MYSWYEDNGRDYLWTSRFSPPAPLSLKRDFLDSRGGYPTGKC